MSSKLVELTKDVLNYAGTVSTHPLALGIEEELIATRCLIAAGEMRLGDLAPAARDLARRTTPTRPDPIPISSSSSPNVWRRGGAVDRSRIALLVPGGRGVRLSGPFPAPPASAPSLSPSNPLRPGGNFSGQDHVSFYCENVLAGLATEPKRS